MLDSAIYKWPLKWGEKYKWQIQWCYETKEFVAETLGVSRQAVSKWENGSSDPSMTNLIVLANLFDINLKEMLKEIR